MAKRYIIFANPPTVSELASTPRNFSHWSDARGWQTYSSLAQASSIEPVPQPTADSSVSQEPSAEEYEKWETQLSSRDEIAQESRWTEGTSFLYPAPTQATCSLDESGRPRAEETQSESLVHNPPQWHFESRSCTRLDELDRRRGPHNFLFHLNDVQPMRTIPLKKPRRGQTTASLAEFECMDDTGATLRVTLWDEAATEIANVCKQGDIVFLSAINLSSYRDRIQGSTTSTTRGQICYRLKPIEAADASYCYDLRLDLEPTTRRVAEMVNWARELFEYG